MENEIKIADLPDGAKVHMTITSAKVTGVYEFRLYKGSPLQRLFELQEEWQEGLERVSSADATGFPTDHVPHTNS